MKPAGQFEDLYVWQQAKKMTIDIYKTFSDNRDFRFRDQIQSASVSVMSNIAEGFERETKPEFIRFLYIAKGSCGEVRSLLTIASELSYIDKEIAWNAIQASKQLGSGIANFIKYLKKAHSENKKKI